MYEVLLSSFQQRSMYVGGEYVVVKAKGCMYFLSLTEEYIEVLHVWGWAFSASHTPTGRTPPPHTSSALSHIPLPERAQPKAKMMFQLCLFGLLSYIYIYI
jgi:hypothetical protein